MSDSIRVSVVVPVHNAERYVEKTLRSVLASQLRELEIIVVDDGSRDRSVEIVRQIGDPRVTLLQQVASGGPARPRNVGIAHARAPYIAFLDADDIVRPDKLSSAADALDRHAEAGFAFADFEHIDANGVVVEPSVLAYKLAECAIESAALENSWRLIRRSELERGLLCRNFIGTSGVLVRAGVLKEVGNFDESLVFSEDLDLWFRLAHRCNALYCPQIGHSYRLAAGSLTYQPSLRTISDRIIVYRKERARRALQAERRRLDHLIAENLAAIGYEYRRTRQRLRAAASFAQALFTYPEIRWMRALVGSLVA